MPIVSLRAEREQRRAVESGPPESATRHIDPFPIPCSFRKEQTLPGRLLSVELIHHLFLLIFTEFQNGISTVMKGFFVERPLISGRIADDIVSNQIAMSRMTDTDEDSHIFRAFELTADRFKAVVGSWRTFELKLASTDRQIKIIAQNKDILSVHSKFSEEIGEDFS